MKLSPAVLDAMLEAGCTAEQIVAAVKAAACEDEEVAAERRERERLRKREQRAAKKAAISMDASEVSHGQRGTPWDIADIPPPFLDKKAPHTPKELNLSAPASFARTRGDGFEQFWSVFPNKVGKADAVKAFLKAQHRVDFESLMAGLHRYVAKTDDRPWCNPSTWLNQDRWADEPATPQARGSPPPKRTIDDVANDLIARMDRANADTTAEDQGYSAAPLRLSAAAW